MPIKQLTEKPVIEATLYEINCFIIEIATPCDLVTMARNDEWEKGWGWCLYLVAWLLRYL
jgi:hypothetical protein